MFKSFFIIITIVIILILNLGKFLDITSKPQKADIIVYLGGGLNERIEKTVALYKEGYSQTNKIIFTGTKWYRYTQLYGKFNAVSDKKDFLIKHGIDLENIIYYKASNTMQEVKIIKKYLIEHHLDSVIFVTDPPHSRRVEMLANTICKFDDEGIKIYIVGSDVSWWNKDKYYLSRNGLLFASLEIIKIPYNYMIYNILERYEILEYFKECFGDIFYKIKKFIVHNISKGWE